MLGTDVTKSRSGYVDGECEPRSVTLVAPPAVPVKGVETGRVSQSTHQGFRARTPDPMDAPSLHARLAR